MENFLDSRTSDLWCPVFLKEGMIKNKIKVISISLFLSAFIMVFSFGGQEADDVVIISNPKTPELKMRIVFKEELTIGVVEGDENYMFGNTIYFNADDEGNIYVTDWDSKEIRKFDSNGKFLLTIGRQGQGPEEFQTVTVPKFDKDKNIYVTDVSGRKILFFNKEGKYLRQIKIPTVFRNLYINSKGDFFARRTMLIEQEGGSAKSFTVIGLFDNQFNVVADIYKESEELTPLSGRDEKSLAKRLADSASENAYKPKMTYFLVENDLIYYGYAEKYEISIYSPEGKLIKIIQREYEPIEVSKQHRDDYIRLWEKEYLPPSIQKIRKEIIQLIKLPKHIPAYKSFILMENGWLAVIVDSIKNEYALFDIFNQEGKYIAQFKSSIPVENLLFKNGKAYAIAIEDDYRFVKRYNYEIQEYKGNKWVKK